MKKCVIIYCFANNQYRKDLLEKNIKFFNKYSVDVILASSDHIDKMDGVKNYITVNHVCNKKFLSDDVFPYIKIDKFIYFSNGAYSKIQSTNWFLKLFQSSINYCKNIGYEFCYVLDFDNIINENHTNIIFDENMDFSKIYFYNLQSTTEYQSSFFYGNVDILSNVFSESNLDMIGTLAKTQPIITNERAIFVLASNYTESSIVVPTQEKDLFLHRNMFSSRNVANVFYDRELKEYWFLQYKGDTCENEFACELFLEDTLIYSNHFKHTSYWSLRKLENNKNYKIKYYDAAISDLTLSKTSNIYTDTNTVTTPNWIQRI